MNFNMPPDMLDATRLTRAGRLTEATSLLQRLLGGGAARREAPSSKAAAQLKPPQLDLTPNAVQLDGPQDDTRPEASHDTAPANLLRDLIGKFGRSDVVSSLQSRVPPLAAGESVPGGGTFLARSYSNHAGTRPYKVYIPRSYGADGPLLPLIVMLHGCTQSPDDFAAGTRMNTVAEEQSCLVAYPVQIQAANQSKCWNWFRTSDQLRDVGEPSLIAGITRQIMTDYRVDPRRVFIAGLSAGGAAAAIMGAAYPELYAGVGVHSGLACGAAHDLPSALRAMKQGAAAKAGHGRNPRPIPTIVFHGDRDSTVNPRNSDQVLAGAGATASRDVEITTENGVAAGGRAYSRTMHTTPDGKTIFEQWRVHGAGHAWSGGSPAGSYTDAHGPDASREMLRFFLQLPPKREA